MALVSRVGAATADKSTLSPKAYTAHCLLSVFNSHRLMCASSSPTKFCVCSILQCKRFCCASLSNVLAVRYVTCMVNSSPSEDRPSHRQKQAIVTPRDLKPRTWQTARRCQTWRLCPRSCSAPTPDSFVSISRRAICYRATGLLAAVATEQKRPYYVFCLMFWQLLMHNKRLCSACWIRHESRDCVGYCVAFIETLELLTYIVTHKNVSLFSTATLAFLVSVFAIFVWGKQDWILYSLPTMAWRRHKCTPLRLMKFYFIDLLLWIKYAEF